MEDKNNKQIDVRNYQEIVNLINEALNNGRVIEIKNESRNEKPNITVVNS